MEGFNSLELFFKHGLLKKNARHLMSAAYYGYTADLYCWDKYLIELYYEPKTGNVARIMLARNKDLDKYVKDISLADLGTLTVA